MAGFRRRRFSPAEITSLYTRASQTEPVSVAGGTRVEDRIDAFLHYMSAERGSSRNTIDAYRNDLTRFASFWVEEGKIKAPLNVMRFDDSLYRMLGEGLLGLTTKPELLVDPRTYRERSTRVTALPGLLVEDFQLTL